MKKILTILLLVAAMVCSGIAVHGYIKEVNAGKSYEVLEKEVVTVLTPVPTATPAPAPTEKAVPGTPTTTPEPTEVPEINSLPLKIDFEKLRKTAPDAYAWLQVPGTDISYPICQHATDNAYYLSHTAEQEGKFEGAVFTENFNKKDFKDPLTVIYGHNMQNGSMFATLHKFEDKAFFDSHREFTIYTPEKTLKYRILAAYSADSLHLLKEHEFENRDALFEYVDSIRNAKSTYANTDSSVSISRDDDYVILSTCTGNDASRYLVQAVLEK